MLVYFIPIWNIHITVIWYILFNSGANPTIASYNASVVNFNNATENLALFENKIIFFYFEKRSSLLQRWLKSGRFSSVFGILRQKNLATLSDCATTEEPASGDSGKPQRRLRAKHLLQCFFIIRVARFSWVQLTKTEKNMPNYQKVYQMAIKYIK
jgi:hypothetical protein